MRMTTKTVRRDLSFLRDCVLFGCVVGVILSMTSLLNADSDLPGEPDEPSRDDQRMCTNCGDWVIPTHVSGITGPVCPNGDDHHLKK